MKLSLSFFSSSSYSSFVLDKILISRTKRIRLKRMHTPCALSLILSRSHETSASFLIKLAASAATVTAETGNLSDTYPSKLSPRYTSSKSSSAVVMNLLRLNALAIICPAWAAPCPSCLTITSSTCFEKSSAGGASS